MDTLATPGVVVPTLRTEGRAKLGWAVFALTSAGFVVALALDLHTGTYKTLIYLGGNVVLALIGLLLTTRRPEHPISWVLAIMALWGTIGGLMYAYAVEALVADPARSRVGSPQRGSTTGGGCRRSRCR